jgi:DNA-binding beta-propeller fold protein YncE
LEAFVNEKSQSAATTKATQRLSKGQRLLVAGALALCALVPSLGIAAGPPLSYVRTIGGSGHALIYPWGMGTLNDGSVLVSDYWNYAVKHYAKDGTYVSTLVSVSSKGSGPSQHLAPYGIAVDPNPDPVTGNIYFYFGDVDSNCGVDKYAYSPTTETASFVLKMGICGLGPSKFKYPAYLDVANNSNVYIMDSRNPNSPVDVYSPSGSELFHFGGPSSPGSYGMGRLNDPRGVGFDGGGRSQWCGGGQCLYIVDNKDLRIQVFDISGNWQYSWGSSGTGPGQFQGPNLRGLAVDKVNGLVYVVDATASLIDEFDLNGNFIRSFGSAGSGLGQVQDGGRDVTVDGDGSLWIADIWNWRAEKFDSNGNFLLTIPNPPNGPAVPPPMGGFNAPRALTVDGSGDIFVADTNNNRIEMFHPDGSPFTQWGVRGAAPDGFNYPRGIASDNADGTIIVADADNVAIKKYKVDSTGHVTMLWLDRATPSGPFKGPEGVAVSADGTAIYVADSQNERVVILDGSGNPVSVWGTRGSGPGQFSAPQSIAVDPSDGTLWIANAVTTASGPVTVEHFTTTGTFLGGFGAFGTTIQQFQQARGIAVNQTYVFVTDVTSNRVKIWNKSTLAFVAAYGGPGSGPGQFMRPMGCALGPDGHVYTVESSGERVQDLKVNI